jgi:hypothetical protein
VRLHLRFGAVAAVAALAAVVGLVIATPNATSKSLNAWCVARADTPSHNSGTARAIGGAVDCPSGSEPWSGTLDLRNGSGSSISPYPVGDNGPGDIIWTGPASSSCSGVSVHSFQYVNDAGHGTSDTSGSVTC